MTASEEAASDKECTSTVHIFASIAKLPCLLLGGGGGSGVGIGIGVGGVVEGDD